MISVLGISVLPVARIPGVCTFLPELRGLSSFPSQGCAYQRLGWSSVLLHLRCQQRV